MKKSQALMIIFLSIAVFVVFAVPVSAQSSRITIPNPFRCGTTSCDLETLLRALIDNILMPVGGVLAVLGFIYAGFLYILARGNTTAIQNAHRTLGYVALGTVLLLGAWVIANVIGNTIDQLRAP